MDNRRDLFIDSPAIVDPLSELRGRACAEHVLPLFEQAEHELGAAADAIKALRAAASAKDRDRAGQLECRWPRAQLPEPIRELVLDDQRVRNDLCWSVFEQA